MLERLELTPETEAMWEQLSALALEREDILTAERCFGATGNVAKARYLHKVNKMARAVELESGMPGSGLAHHTVQSKLAVLAGNLPRAEQQLLQQGLIEETMEMYQARGRSARDGREMGARWARDGREMGTWHLPSQELHKWEESIAVAEQRAHPEVQTLKANYFQWLSETGQEEKVRMRQSRCNHDGIAMGSRWDRDGIAM